MVDRESDLGLTTILLADSYEKLANSCDYILENTETFQGIHSVNGSTAARQAIAFDAVNKDKMEAFGRRLASLQVLEVEESRSLPDQLTFFQMLGIQKPGDLDVRERWAKNRTYDNIRGQLGVKAGGDPCFLDVHEKYHGPHGLVAGTTGSGKSETLQTWMLSLAINYSPDDISFFIIDFKGGGMGNLFRGLPHVVGQISNLSGNQVRRAMISIKSENKRRQRIFNENGVNHIDQYTRLLKDGEIDIAITPVAPLLEICRERGYQIEEPQDI
jgi:S-DNA-T family DNA segregation ATPase FtsK/SpoIIIE